jgi:hypothetical protein
MACMLIYRVMYRKSGSGLAGRRVATSRTTFVESSIARPITALVTFGLSRSS